MHRLQIVESVLLRIDVVLQKHLDCFIVSIHHFGTSKDKLHILLGVILGPMSLQRQVQMMPTTPKPIEARHTVLLMSERHMPKE